MATWTPSSRATELRAALQDGAVYHTYSTYARDTAAVMGDYRFLDLSPWGRNEKGPEP
jgi:predicted dithiol-disulfide oxidoreductase (DUF899 family)